MQAIDLQSITIDKVHYTDADMNDISFSVLRLDKIHPIISGNKWFKLRFYLEEAIVQNKQTILTFGGAYSNHIIATAAAAKQHALKSIGIIRGEEGKKLSLTLEEAKELGMQLYFISREDYSNKKMPDELKEIKDQCYIIDEGGYGKNGMKGASTIINLISSEKYTHICCAVGTGTMTAGLIANSSSQQKITGVSVLKNNRSIESEINLLLEVEMEENKWTIIHDYPFGGYAKYNPQLLDFMNEFYRQTNIPTDFVYTGKLFFAIIDLNKKGYFNKQEELLVIHSGGLQGNRSLAKGSLIF